MGSRQHSGGEVTADLGGLSIKILCLVDLQSPFERVLTTQISYHVGKPFSLPPLTASATRSESARMCERTRAWIAAWSIASVRGEQCTEEEDVCSPSSAALAPPLCS